MNDSLTDSLSAVYVRNIGAVKIFSNGGFESFQFRKKIIVRVVTLELDIVKTRITGTMLQ